MANRRPPSTRLKARGRRVRLNEMLGTTCCLRIGWKDNLSCSVLQHESVANGVEQPTRHALLPFGRKREPNATYFYAGLDRNIFARINTGNQIPPERGGVCAITLQREIVEIAIARVRIDSAQDPVRGERRPCRLHEANDWGFDRRTGELAPKPGVGRVGDR